MIQKFMNDTDNKESYQSKRRLPILSKYFLKSGNIVKQSCGNSGSFI